MIDSIMAVILGALIGVYITHTSNIEAPKEHAAVEESPVEQVVVISNDEEFEEEEDIEDPIEQLIFHDSNYNWNNK